MSLRLNRFVCAMAAAGLAVLTLAGPAHATFNPIGTEPVAPYAQPVDANVPKRGCATTLSDPTNATGSIPAVQVIYAWHEGNGNNYATYVQQIAKIVDRMDWLLDESTNYDQHINLSCRTGYDTSTYAGYAQALVVPEKIEAADIPGETTPFTIADDLEAAGYDNANRKYLVFEDFNGTATAWCDGVCVATTDDWDSGTAMHELIHLYDVDHAKVSEVPDTYSLNDIMISQYNDWQIDQEFNTYYDPSETTATFYTSSYPDTRLVNLANYPVFTAPTCCDVGYSNDLLTAQERTIEAQAPSGTPAGFGFSGGGWIQVTPAGSDSAVSARYYDGRRSLKVNVQSWADGILSVTRKPAVTAGQRYKFFARLTTATSGNVKLRLSWYNSSNTLLSTTNSSTFALTTGWQEYNVSALAPTGAATVQLSVVSPSGQSFAYLADSLQLNQCNNGQTTDGCRLSG
ncbi:hypothetical protein Skr01_73100 [Sphaerisporangium krabiense]|uniref:CBM-cenC domain-containing protein n=1 Tax=Sphaerisporangium krabiense TaxID=763782 RepID=A0A7W8Z8U7_9ACTN|nr:hypothetical protein [Sphaerisporangium krabiense]MBB5629568.1 hypothetical protein [Sphaerisporangium krabiense]GII67225.1 hypothetical protein Skr01_73100 [Sphaerisporangium krabiense]